MAEARTAHTATLLRSGKVLVAVVAQDPRETAKSSRGQKSTIRDRRLERYSAYGSASEQATLPCYSGMERCSSRRQRSNGARE
jgi:hypothetical protein